MRGKRTLALVLAVMLLLAAMLPVSAEIGDPKNFSDVPGDAWYKDEVDKLSMLGIINGYPDGTFHPDETLTKGEFLAMLYVAAEAIMYDDDNAIHWAQPYWNALNDMGIISGSGIKCSFEDLNSTITRNEMAVLITNVLYKAYFEEKITMTNVTSAIADYSSVPSAYQYYVEQAFGKGVLSGYEDRTFRGGDGLKRCEAASVVYRMLWANDRTQISNVTVVKPDYTPVATQWQKNGWINAYGTASPELRQLLFGDASKSSFSSPAEAANYIVTVTIPVWKLDKSGNKYSSTMTVDVHKELAEDVKGIFQQIYDDPEQFPIYSVGGARYTDTMRHAWGCAIDINAAYNAECRAYYNTGTAQMTSGSGWWPMGTNWSMFSGSLSSPSPYSIPAGGSVVKAFADYGWGWGGQGYSVRGDNTQKFDYMHFSIMASGG